MLLLLIREVTFKVFEGIFDVKLTINVQCRCTCEPYYNVTINEYLTFRILLNANLIKKTAYSKPQALKIIIKTMDSYRRL